MLFRSQTAGAAARASEAVASAGATEEPLLLSLVSFLAFLSDLSLTICSYKALSIGGGGACWTMTGLEMKVLTMLVIAIIAVTAIIARPASLPKFSVDAPSSIVKLCLTLCLRPWVRATLTDPGKRPASITRCAISRDTLSMPPYT